MRKSRITKAQIIGILQEAIAGATIGEVCRRRGIAAKTYFRRTHQYGGSQVAETKKLKALEDENRCLKKPVARRLQKGCSLSPGGSRAELIWERDSRIRP